MKMFFRVKLQKNHAKLETFDGGAATTVWAGSTWVRVRVGGDGGGGWRLGDCIQVQTSCVLPTNDPYKYQSTETLCNWIVGSFTYSRQTAYFYRIPSFGPG